MSLGRVGRWAWLGKTTRGNAATLIGMQPADATRRGAAAKALVAADARWLVDVAMSAAGDDQIGPVIGLSFIGHFSRIAYEGSRVATSSEPTLGVPVLADLLSDNHADIIERARHATKLLDDSKKDFSSFEGEIASYLALHRAHFSGNSVAAARFLETDLGLLKLNGRVLMGSISNQLRYGLAQTVDPDTLGPSLYSVATELGGVTLVLAALTGQMPSTNGTLDLSDLRDATYTDHRSVPYLERRFDQAMTEAVKLLLLLVEGEVNLAANVLPATRPGHDSAVLRAQFVVAVHAVHAVQKILDSAPGATDSGTESVRRMLNEPATQVLAKDPGARQLRNQAVHYRLRDDITSLDDSRPMMGLVEQLWAGQTYEQLDIDISSLLNRMSNILNGWQQN